jgi:4-hydroxybenzoate polyprenyltransferase
MRTQGIPPVASTLSAREIPLCVDLDGTLTPVDTLEESLLSLAKAAPAALLMLVVWLVRGGKAAMKQEVAARSKYDVSLVPINHALLEWLIAEHATGRRLVLTTAADSSIANDMASRVGLFDQVLSSDGTTNLSAGAKQRMLVARFGERGFDYAGNAQVDEVIWRSARNAIVVGSSNQVKRARAVANVERVFPGVKGSPVVWLKALRVHQWAKNVLIFLPALLAHSILQPAVLIASASAFASFSLCASSIYLINDLLDLPADRHHPRKRSRPFAAGQLSARSGLITSFSLLTVALGIALFVGDRFLMVLAGYYALTWAYSLRLKRAAIVDVMTLAGLYTVRIIAGAAATATPVSFWLLAFSIFIFLSLGIVKRYTEILETPARGTIAGRGYSAKDLPLLLNLGVSAGYSTVIVVALYINSSDSALLYRHSKPLWMICPLLLYWLSRVWLLTTRGEMHDDPVVFAMRDRISLYVLGLLGLIALISI